MTEVDGVRILEGRQCLVPEPNDFFDRERRIFASRSQPNNYNLGRYVMGIINLNTQQPFGLLDSHAKTTGPELQFIIPPEEHSPLLIMKSRRSELNDHALFIGTTPESAGEDFDEIFWQSTIGHHSMAEIPTRFTGQKLENPSDYGTVSYENKPAGKEPEQHGEKVLNTARAISNLLGATPYNQL